MQEINKSTIGKKCFYEGVQWKVVGISMKFDGTWLRIKAKGVEKTVKADYVVLDDAK